MRLFTRLPVLGLPLALAAASLVAGCSGTSDSSTLAPSAASRSATTLQGLTAVLAADSAVISPGGTVNYTLSLTNNAATAMTIHQFEANGSTKPNFPGSLQITDAGGSVVYPSSATPAPVGNTITTTLAAGQSLSKTVAVSVFSQSGQYSATETITAQAPGANNTVVGPLPLTVR